MTGALLAIVCPLAVGAAIGALLRRLWNGRVADTLGIAGCMLLPPALWVVATVLYPVVGLWDAITEGLLVGAGIAWVAHRRRLDPRKLGLSLASTVLGFLVLEVFARVFLPPPPAYPIGDGPHLLLSDMIRFTGPDGDLFRNGAMPPRLERVTMAADRNGRGHADRPPSIMVTREVVCAIAYGPSYHGVIDVSPELRDVWPDAVSPREGAERRVLHVGDSLVYGANAAREERFTTVLERLEPEVQHVNGGISGTAPDDYLVVTRRWIERQPFELAVIYIFTGNDVAAIGAPHPCSDWDSLLVYEDGRARLRYPDAPRAYRGVGLQWLTAHSPIPYLLRVLIARGSVAAAHLGAAEPLGFVDRHRPNDGLRELEMILRTARDVLEARGTPLVVVLLPPRWAVAPGGDREGAQAAEMEGIARRLGIGWLDASDVLRAAIAGGASPYHSDQTHFNAEGHALIGRWLHERLPAVTPPTGRP